MITRVLSHDKVASFKKDLEHLISNYGYDKSLDMPAFLISGLIYSLLEDLGNTVVINKAYKEGRVWEE